MLKNLLLILVACLVAATVSAQQPQQCPFSREDVEQLNFKPISACVSRLKSGKILDKENQRCSSFPPVYLSSWTSLSSILTILPTHTYLSIPPFFHIQIFEPTAVTQTNCDACVCSFVDATLPLWIEGGLVDCAAADFGADSPVATTLNNLMSTCAMTLGPKLSRDLGVNLFQLPRLFSGVQSCPTDGDPPMCLLQTMASVCPSDSPVMSILVGQISAAASPMMEM